MIATTTHTVVILNKLLPLLTNIKPAEESLEVL